MGDILESIEELTGDDHTYEDEEFDDVSGASLELSEVLEDESTLTKDEAQELTDAIRSTAVATYVLLTRAHEEKAHRALGYDTWAEYVKAEFDMSAARSYQLLDLGKAVKLIEASAPEGTDVRLTEAQARDIKRELPRITERVAEETKDVTPDVAADKIDDIVEDARQQQAADEKVIAAKEKSLEDAKTEGYQAGVEAAADALLEADSEKNVGDNADDSLVEMEVSGENALSPADSMNIYNFINALTGVLSLPEPDDLVDTIPESRYDTVFQQASDASSWLNRFVTLLEAKKSE